MSAGDASPPAATTFNVVVCLFPDAQLLDYAGPLDMFGFLVESDLVMYSMPMPPKLLDITYLGPVKTVIRCTSGPPVVPQETYNEALETKKQYDVLLIPGGGGVEPTKIPTSLLKFITAQVKCAQFVLSVCTGSWALAQAGVLEGRRATTNKALFHRVLENSSKNITWIPHARWVVDGIYWSSSGVAAGLDMAAAWLEHIVGSELADRITTSVEYTPAKAGDL
ncbi:class I glutamine amidotransferase-like protein [Auriculariales sp. MPI-PUGE-AT-0066]|nr:class I glutamine amidotransferase-like protein [Auriculariales sp. MPI-PUGE-AT-0066]